MRPSRLFLAAAAAIAAGGAFEAALGPDAPAPPAEAILAGPEGHLAARAAGGWCPRPPDAFVPCAGGPDRIRIRPATAAEAGLLSGAAGAAAPWRLEGWAARAAALGLDPAAGDAPDADLSAQALAAAARLPPASFLAAVPAGGEPGVRRATLDLSRPDSGPLPWRVTLTEIRLHAGRAWTIQAERWTPRPPDAADLARLREGAAAVPSAIDAPAPPDPAAQAWARVARPDGPDLGEGRALAIPGGWRLEGPTPPAPAAAAFAEEAAALRPALAAALRAGTIGDALTLAFARAAIHAASGPPGPVWGPAAAACGRGLLIEEGMRICLLPDGRAAAARDLPDGARLVKPLARADAR